MTNLASFRAAYALDDNAWWMLSSGEHQNLFDQACEEIDNLHQRLDPIESGLEAKLGIAEERIRQLEERLNYVELRERM